MVLIKFLIESIIEPGEKLIETQKVVVLNEMQILQWSNSLYSLLTLIIFVEIWIKATVVKVCKNIGFPI